MVMLARKEFAPKNFAELVAYVKANREKFTMASSGMGSATHLCGMLFQEAIGVPLTMVQYKGAGAGPDRRALGPGRPDLRPADHDVEHDPQRRPARLCADRAQAHGVAARRADRGGGGHAEPRHRRVVRPLRPKGTPQPIIEVLNKALRAVVQDETVAEKLAEIETYLLPLDQATPEAHRRKLASQIELWRPIIEKAGIQAE